MEIQNFKPKIEIAAVIFGLKFTFPSDWVWEIVSSIYTETVRLEPGPSMYSVFRYQDLALRTKNFKNGIYVHFKSRTQWDNYRKIGKKGATHTYAVS